MNTLSLCLICQNEEQNIEKCLKNIKDIVDEIIIVDGGSTDQTLEIAKKYTDKIYNFTWIDDFSASRNFSIGKSTCDWILVLDCDEYLLDATKEMFLKLIDNKSYDGYCLGLQGQNNIFPLLRLFRNKKNMRYKNKLHEQIIHCIDKNRVANTDIIINHSGYSQESLEEKNKMFRNLKILFSYEESEKDCFYYYCLGNCYFAMSDYNNCEQCYLEALNLYDDPYGFTESLVNNLAECYYVQKKYKEYDNLKQHFNHFVKF